MLTSGMMMRIVSGVPARPRSAITKAVVTISGMLVLMAPALSAQDMTGPPIDPGMFLKAPEGQAGLFALRDDRALHALQYLNCMNVASLAGQQGKAGSVPQDAVVTCVRDISGWHGIFGVVGKDGNSFRVVSRLAVNGPEAVRIQGKVEADSAAALATLRALWRGTEASVMRKRSNYEFMPIPVVLETFVEVWFLPVQKSASRTLVGGDSLIQLNADASRELGHFKKSPQVRELAAPSGSSYLIISNEEEVPLVSEIFAARLALLTVPEVRILTRKYASMISNSTRKWEHTPRKN